MDKTAFPELYRLDKKGNVLMWKTWVEGPVVYTEFGRQDGERQVSSKVSEPKNVGRANATTAETQALKDAQSAWENKKTRKYSESIEEAPAQLPMLAKSYNPKKPPAFPFDMQPKLDGVRCMARMEDGVVTLYSRSNRIYDQVPHINQYLAGVLKDGEVLDGELYAHGMTLQNINKLVKKNRPESVQIYFNVYDVPAWRATEPCGAWSERKSHLEEFESLNTDKSIVHVVETVTVTSIEEMEAQEQDYLTQGYEGAIIRLHDSPYEYTHRSNGLLKLKRFQDAEYPIIGYNEGRGKLVGTVIWTCETPEGKPFDVTPSGPIDAPERALKTAGDHVGKMLKVKFFDFSEDGIPKYGVGLGFRDTE